MCSYGRDGKHLPSCSSSRRQRPVVVWNMTRRCVSGAFTATRSQNKIYAGELTTPRKKSPHRRPGSILLSVILFSVRTLIGLICGSGPARDGPGHRRHFRKRR